MTKTTVRHSDTILESLRYIVPAAESAAAAEKKAAMTTKPATDKGEQ